MDTWYHNRPRALDTLDAARRVADDAIATVEAAGFSWATASSHMGKGAAYAESDPATALEALERVQALAEQCGNRVHESLAVAEVAALRARAADPIAALRGLQQMLEATRGATDAMFARHGLANLIPLFERLGQPEAAVTLYGRLTRVFQSHALIPDLPDTILRTRRAVGAATFEAAASRGTDTTAE